MKQDEPYLEHVLDCIQRVKRYTREGRAAFLADDKTRDAVTRCLQTLAESTQRLSPRLRGRHPEVDWRAIAGFRNVLVHNYMGIDYEQVWRIVERDLPGLEATLREAKNFGNEGTS